MKRYRHKKTDRIFKGFEMECDGITVICEPGYYMDGVHFVEDVEELPKFRIYFGALCYDNMNWVYKDCFSPLNNEANIYCMLSEHKRTELIDQTTNNLIPAIFL